MTKWLSWLAAAMLTGCFSVTVAESPVLGEESGGHVVVRNFGWMLFGNVPLVCGNANVDSWCPVTFFKDEITPEYAQAKLVDVAVKRNCDLEDVKLMGDNGVLFDVWFVPIPWVLVYKETNLSANLVRRKGAAR